MKKDPKVRIIFDDVDYSDEERDRLWGGLFLSLTKLAHKQEGENSCSVV